MTNEEQQKQPEPGPRASSALLDAAKATLAELRNHNLWFSSEDPLVEAIEAEEARGPSEMDPLRRAREHYKGEYEQLRKERDEALAELAACFGYLPVVPGPALAWDGIHLEPHVVRVADEYSIMRERDEAVARAEKAEPRASSALLEAAKRAYESCPMSCGSSKRELDHLRSMNDLYVAIEAEEARGPSEVDDPDWHQIMTKWLEQRDAGRPCSPEDLAAVVATIVRRDLARGAK